MEPSTATPPSAFTTFSERWKAFPKDNEFIARESPDHIWGCFGVQTGFCYHNGDEADMKRLAKNLAAQKANPDAPVNIRKESFVRAIKESTGVKKKASQLKVGDWIVSGKNNLRVVSVTDTRDGDLKVSHDFGSGGEPATSFYKKDEIVLTERRKK
jgi:hypothetical protein